ncbi:MFS transporter [Blastococcus sp. TBT05-19]|uniref:MFS transporter n=1 Tax=Blastococcus sp. TBT05-19 TaxID=2250581 RepID=UPI000DE97E30|nr:MFS transporter [Blastococcus sp. TBT05-19]RBY90221.1 MFS transporter [Blastococcus sp. TBT05-19]
MTLPKDETPALDRRSLRKLMAAGLIGSSIEWYDFFIYATAAALVFGELFFPDASPLMGTLLSFSTFWAGFIARPIGGLVFGHFGDKFGRKPALVTCLILMGSATFLIGLLPTADSIGVLAPIALVFLRFLQGIAVGGQWGGVILLLTENAGRDRQGRAGTFGQMGVPIGVILGNIVFLAVSATTSAEAFVSWGWRIPFLASAVLLPVVMFIQLRVEDTPVFRELKSHSEEAADEKVAQAPLKEVVLKHRRPVLLGAGLLFGTNAIFYISIAGVLDYATRDLGVDRDELLAITLAASAISVFVIYFSGGLSDRIGRRPPILVGAAVIALWAFPFFWLIDTAKLPLIFVALVGGLIGSSLTYGPLAAFLAEMFEPRIRYSGASLAYQLAAILVSGATPFIMTALLAATGSSASVSAYVCVMGVITFLSAFVLRETRTKDEIRGEAGRDLARTD